MKVCIAEKPSVAREIANVLGASTKKDGYYEGNGYQVTWTFGHFCTLYLPDDYKPHWKSWNLNTLPMLPEKFEIKLIDNAGVAQQFNKIKKLFDATDLVINCGDAGQEGELIQRWVLKQANYTGKVQRLWISSLTSEAIKAGFNDLKNADDYNNLYYAGSSRAIGDWLLGMNATRLFTLKYGGPKQVLSIGRVQTPTLAMLVNRHHEIANFKPQTYWELQTIYRDTVFHNESGKFTKKEEGEALLEKVKDKLLTITAVSKKKGKEAPPRLFDLTSLQVYCNNKFGLTAEQTLKITQGLYEQKLVTYPRVDTTFLPNDQYPKIEGILKNLSNYATFTSPLLGKKIRKSAKVFNDKKVTDHHAIIPTGFQSGLSDNSQKVYDAITRHFIAAFYPDCIVANTAVQAEVEKVGFKANGKEILEDGWRVVMAKSNTSAKAKDEEKVMPTFVKGETGPHEPGFLEKQTKAPRYYTEATLLRAMETAGKQVDDDELRDLMKANGIGRPSTRANIIETLFRRKYIERRKKQIHATSTGVQLIGLVQNDLLKSAELTGRWEKRLKEIEQGEFNAARFIYNMKKMVDDLVAEVRLAKDAPKISSASLPNIKVTATKTSGVLGHKCPKCKQGTLLKGKSAYGCSRWKADCKFTLPFVFMGKKLSENQVLRLLEKGSTVALKGFKKGDQKLNGILNFNENYEVVFEESEVKSKVEKQVKSICPKCKKGEIVKGKSAFGCNRWKEGCDYKMTFEEVRKAANGKPLTKALVHEILEKG